MKPFYIENTHSKFIFYDIVVIMVHNGQYNCNLNLPTRSCEALILVMPAYSECMVLFSPV